jgi:hypothetical protein
MTAQDDPNLDVPHAPAAGLGGGLLGLVREEVTALRTSAAVERAALIDTIASKLTDLEQQLSELRAELATARSEAESARATAASTLESVQGAVQGVAGLDIAGLVQHAVANQAEGIVRDVVAAVTPQIERTAGEVTSLRNALLGPST